MPANDLVSDISEERQRILDPLPPLPPRDGKCNARLKRRRGYCPALSMPNGRCKTHGGMTPPCIGAIIRHSKSEYLPKAVYARFETLNGTALENLEESVRIQQSLETEIIERLGSGESAAAWERLIGLVAMPGITSEQDDEDEIDALMRENQMLKHQMSQIRETVTEAAHNFAVKTQLRHELQDIQESQRKLTETLSKVRKEVQETYTKEQFNTLLLAALASLKRHVEAHALAAVAEDFQSFDTKKLLKAASRN